MSFSSDTKKELTNDMPEKKCCMLAEIAGYMRVNGSIGLMGGGKVSAVITSENPAVARHFKKMLKEYFNVKANLEISKNNTFKKGNSYRLSIDEGNLAEKILRETGILAVREGSNVLRPDIPPDIIKKKCCKKAYLRGVFMGSGTISDPEKSYHLELVCNNEALANDLKKLVNSFGLNSKVVKRKNNYVVYMKEAEQIVDFLNIIGAYGPLLDIENVRVVKTMRNKANRIVNCESANVDKAIDAAARQIGNIKFIEETVGLSVLSEKLRKVAALRLENRELTLTELAELTDPPVSKSGINHRLSKINEFAEKLRGERMTTK